MSTEIEGCLYESLRADQVQAGDTVHMGVDADRRCVVWGVEPRGASQTELFLGTCADVPFELLGSITEWNSNPVWVAAYDAYGRTQG
jgi:hypothetical protein